MPKPGALRAPPWKVGVEPGEVLVDVDLSDEGDEFVMRVSTIELPLIALADAAFDLARGLVDAWGRALGRRIMRPVDQRGRTSPAMSRSRRSRRAGRHRRVVHARSSVPISSRAHEKLARSQAASAAAGSSPSRPVSQSVSGAVRVVVASPEQGHRRHTDRTVERARRYAISPGSCTISSSRAPSSGTGCAVAWSRGRRRRVLTARRRQAGRAQLAHPIHAGEHPALARPVVHGHRRDSLRRRRLLRQRV